MVITESDTIQEYYIIRRYKSTIHEGIYIVKAERCSRAARATSRAKQEKSWEEELQMFELLLYSDHHWRIRCAL